MNDIEKVRNTIIELKKEKKEFTFYDIRIRTGFSHLKLGKIILYLCENDELEVL